MPKVQNTFIKSKMNQDLDARLLPNGEYREAFNVSISKSEGDDVGALENIKGNASLIDFDLKFKEGSTLDAANVECIGKYIDVTLNVGFFFFTSYSDCSIDNISHRQNDAALFLAGDNNWIVYYNFKDLTSKVLCKGSFLNFSKTNPIICKSLEDLLFWTDNRNQPRKINWKTALNNPDYYTHEDHISVAKYYPFNPIRLYKDYSGNIENTMRNKTDRFLPASSIFTTKTVGTVNPSGSEFLLDITTTTTGSSGYFLPNKNGGSGFSSENFYATLDGVGEDSGPSSFNLINVDKVLLVGSSFEVTLRSSSESALQAVKQNMQIYLHQESLDYDATWPGDEDYLSEKFVRFSYRFKFDDDEYSLIAPFTQEVFIPRQYGNFIGQDDVKTKQSLIVSFMKNLVNDVELIIDLPYQNGIQTAARDLFNKLKVKEVDILFKDSESQSINVLDTITKQDIDELPTSISTNTNINYNYQSRKPVKVLPESEITRVYDQVPLRALSLEIVGNRVVYGNFVAKNSYPEKLDYEVSIGSKGTPSTGANAAYADREYPVHNLKQNRTYQVGFVLADRYGRQSEVILSTKDDATSLSAGLNYGGSTIYHPYREEGSFSSDWWGDDLKLLINSAIPADNTSSLVDQDYPGLFSDDIQTSAYNPLGWYTYKIVVKQQEQEYYNVYVPGINSRIPKVNYTESPGTSIDSLTPGEADSTRSNYRNNFETPVYQTYDPGTGVENAPANKGSRDYVFDQLLTFSFNGQVQIELTGENINKVPKSLIDVGPRDRDFPASDVQLYGRVRSVNYKLSSQYFPIQSSANFVNPDTVDNIREFNTFSIDPLYCKHYQSYDVSGTPRRYTYILYDFYNSGGILNKQSNTFIATINQAGNVPMGYDTDFIDSVSTVESWFTETPITSPFSARYTTLGVYETKPFKSDLELFYESSTSGIISNLNDSIGTTNNINYLRLGDGTGASVTNSQPYVVNFSESTTTGTDITGDIVPMFDLGITMDSGTTLEINQLYINNVLIADPSDWFTLITSNSYPATSGGNINSYILRTISEELYYSKSGDQFKIVFKAVNGGAGEISYLNFNNFSQSNSNPIINTQPLSIYTISPFQPGQPDQTLFYVYPYPGDNAGVGDVVVSNGSIGSERGLFDQNSEVINYNAVGSEWDSTVNAWRVFARNFIQSVSPTNYYMLTVFDEGGLSVDSNQFQVTGY
jgi:hypothetical protein